METTKKSRFASKLHRFAFTGDYVIHRLLGTLILLVVFMVLRSITHEDPRFKDMESGFIVLAMLYLVRMFCMFLCASSAQERKQALAIDWLAGCVFRVGAVILLFLGEGHMMGHGFRGALWLVFTGYQCAAVTLSLFAAYGNMFGLERFNIRARRLARFEQHVVADLMRSLKH